MKYTGRVTAFFLVLLTNFIYVMYYYSQTGYVASIEYIGLPIMLALSWWTGKQYDKLKLLEMKHRLQKKEFARKSKFFQTIFDKAPIGVALIDETGRPVMSNKKLQEMLGYSEKELSLMTFNEFSDSDNAKYNMKLIKDLIEGKIDSYQLEKQYYRKDGTIFWGSITSALFPSENVDSFYVIGMMTDVTERKKAQEDLHNAYKEMRTLSTIDGLTNIANRRYFDHYLSAQWEKSVKNSTPLSLIMIDIDYFKQYNDQYGHLAGDECLKTIARILEKTVKRSSDLVARIGGEEFAIILPNTNQFSANIVAHNLLSTVSALKIPHKGSIVNPFVTVSIGAATMIPDSYSKKEDLILAADKALYQAKQKGRNRIEMMSS